MTASPRPAPPRWSQAVLDDVDRAMREAVDLLYLRFGETCERHDTPLDWNEPAVRVWILRRLMERAFPKWKTYRWLAPERPGEPVVLDLEPGED